MGEGRRLVAQRLEQLDLHSRVGDVVLAADHVADMEVGVVDDAGEGVEEGAVGADDDGIGQRADVDRLVAADEVVPRDDGRQRREALLGVVETEAPVRAPPLGLEPLALGIVELEAGTVVDGRQTARELALALAVELVLGLVAGIEPAPLFQALGRRLVARHARRLTLLALPGEPEPGEVPRMPSAKASVERCTSVSSRRSQNVPPCLRANSQLRMAVRTLPTCRRPVGLGAKRTVTGHVDSGVRYDVEANRRHPIEGVSAKLKRAAGLRRRLRN